MASEYTVLIGGENGGKITVRAVTADTVGLYDERDETITRPCNVDLAALLPYRMRKAFNRSSGRFWYDKTARITRDGRTTATPYLALHYATGAHMATLYAIAN